MIENRVEYWQRAYFAAILTNHQLLLLVDNYSDNGYFIRGREGIKRAARPGKEWKKHVH